MAQFLCSHCGRMLKSHEISYKMHTSKTKEIFYKKCNECALNERINKQAQIYLQRESDNEKFLAEETERQLKDIEILNIGDIIYFVSKENELWKYEIVRVTDDKAILNNGREFNRTYKKNRLITFYSHSILYKGNIGYRVATPELDYLYELTLIKHSILSTLDSLYAKVKNNLIDFEHGQLKNTENYIEVVYKNIKDFIEKTKSNDESTITT